MPPVGFEITVSAGERPQTYALDRAATGTGHAHKYNYIHYVIIYAFNIIEFALINSNYYVSLHQ